MWYNLILQLGRGLPEFLVISSQNWRDFLMKNVMVLVVFILCFCWACSLYAQNGGKTLHILYSVDERGAITPCG